MFTTVWGMAALGNVSVTEPRVSWTSTTREEEPRNDDAEIVTCSLREKLQAMHVVPHVVVMPLTVHVEETSTPSTAERAQNVLVRPVKTTLGPWTCSACNPMMTTVVATMLDTRLAHVAVHVYMPEEAYTYDTLELLLMAARGGGRRASTSPNEISQIEGRSEST